MKYDEKTGDLLSDDGKVLTYTCSTFGYKMYNPKGVANRSPKRAHRIIWEMHNGPIPKGMQIDHIDGDCANNKLENLRLATNRENSCNREVGEMTNITKRGNSHRVSLTIFGKSKYFGSYDNLELAQLVRDEARDTYYGEFSGRYANGTS
jgi:hypothetical protein